MKEKILDIDLSRLEIHTIDLDPQIVENYIGGLGLGVKILYDEVGPDVDGLSPDNIIIIAPGPLTGTQAPTNSRTEVVTKSPYTGLIGLGNFGGFFGPRMRFAGYEAIIIRGASERPVYLWIDDEQVRLKSAGSVWGQDTWDTTDALNRELGEGVSILAIGPAGENLVKFACPIADKYHAPGRCHAGCVMGAKKLKAIAVRGTRRTIPVADRQRFSAATKEALKRISSYPDWKPLERKRCGSQYSLKMGADRGLLRSGAFGRSEFPADSDIRNLPDSFEEYTTLVPKTCCYFCPMGEYYGCDLWADVKKGPYAPLKMVGVSFSLTGREWGYIQGVKSYPAMWKCKELCNRYGMDQLTPILFAMELLDRGVITKDQLDGIDLRVSNESAIMEMLGKIAARDGVGDILAEGSVAAAARFGNGAEKYLHTLKGMEILAADPRLLPAEKILGYITCPRGGDDLLTTHAFFPGYPPWARRLGWSEQDYLAWRVDFLDMTAEESKEVFGDPPDVDALQPRHLDGKAAMVKWYEQVTTMTNALGLCIFATVVWSAIGPTLSAKLYSAASGIDATPGQLRQKADRIYNLMKAYIIREGWSRKDDDWPALFYEEPFPGEVQKGALLSKDEVNTLLDDYYATRGWDKATGLPTRKTLAELGLDDVADELSKLGRLGG